MIKERITICTLISDEPPLSSRFKRGLNKGISKTKILRRFAKTKKQVKNIFQKLNNISKRARTFGRNNYLFFIKRRQLCIKVYKLAVICISLIIITDSAHAYTVSVNILDTDINTIKGTTEQVNSTVSQINNYLSPKFPSTKLINNDLNSTQETFIEKSAIIETQSRDQIEQKKADDEYQKKIAANYNRDLYYRENSTLRNAIVPSSFSASGNSYYYGYCTWYVKNKRPDLPNQLGNGGAWYYNAQFDGLSTGPTPKEGAVIVTGESGYGHVGYVESVNGNQVTISEMNYSGWGVVNQRTLDANDPVVKGFVY